MRCLTLTLLVFGMLDSPLAAQKKDNPAEDPDSGDELGKLRPVVQTYGHQNTIGGLFFTHDNKLVSASSNTVCLTDVQTRERLKTLYFPGSMSRIRAAALAADDKTLAVNFLVYGGAEPCLRLMNLETGAVRSIQAAQSGTYYELVFDPAGDRLLHIRSGGGSAEAIDWYDGMRAIWDKSDKETLKLQPSLRAGKVDLGVDNIFRLAFSPLNDQIVVAGESKVGKAGVCVWRTNVPHGAEPPRPPLRLGVLWHPWAVGWSPKATKIAVGHENGLNAWDVNGKLLGKLDKSKLGAFSRELKTSSVQIHYLRFLNDDEVVICWRAERGGDADREVGATIVHLRDAAKTVDLAHFPSPFAAFPKAAVSPDGNWLAFTHGAYGASFTIVDLKKRGVHFAVPSENEAPSEVAWSKDGSTLLWNSTRADSKTVPFQGIDWKKMASVRFDKQDEKELHQSFYWRETRNSLFRAVRVIDDAGKQDPFRIDVVKGDQTVRIGRREESGSQPLTVFTVSADPVKHPWLLVAHGAFMRQYDADGQKKKIQYRNGGIGFLSLTSSPDGSLCFGADTLGRLQVFNVNLPGNDQEKGAGRLKLFASGEEWVIWTPDGYYACSPNGDKIFGWIVADGPDTVARFMPAARLRDVYYRPRIIQGFLQYGNMTAAIKKTKAANIEFEQRLPPRATIKVMEKEKEPGVFNVIAMAAATRGSLQNVSELHLLLDGRPVTLANGKVAVEKFDPPVAELKQPVQWTVKLDPGASGKLSARVHAKESYNLSNEVAVRAPASSIRKKGTLYYFGVGVAEYAVDKGNTNPQYKLDWCKKDVDDLADGFKAYIFPKSRYANFQPIALTNAAATRAAILAKMDELKKTLKPADLLVVHFSCHGEKESKEGGLYLLPHDFNPNDLKNTAVAGDKLQERFGECECPVLLLLDACHSGAMKSPSEELLRRLSDERTGVTVMTAALSYQKAEERKGLQNGVFTAALLEGMKSGEAVDPFNKRQYAHNLYAHVFGFVNRETNGRQMPVFSQSGATPPIVLKEATPAQSNSP